MCWKVFVANLPFTCNGCTSRHPGCHGKCEKYIREKAEWERRKAEETKIRQSWDYTNTLIADKRNSTAKSRKNFTGYRKSYYNV